MTWMAFLTENALKGTLVLVAACAGIACLRAVSASMRHFLWTAAFGALLLLPLAMLIAPKWGPETDTPVIRSVETLVVHPGTPAKTPSKMPVLLFVWILGWMAAATRFLAGAGRTSWMVHRAAEAHYAQAMLGELATALRIRRRVRVFQSAAAPMPLTWGIVRPVVVLPDDASSWPEARLRTVLLHELVHVQRLDLLAQAVAQVACCFYWFNPLAWIAWRQLRKERERACDDAVLLRGVPAHDYAGHLMDLVRVLAAKRSAYADAPAMAEPADLESRVRALLDRGRNRRPVSRWAAVAISTALVAALIPIAALTARAQAASGTVVGLVEDPTGARVPNCRVTAKNQDGSNQETTMTGEDGGYRFTGIPSGSYTLEFSSPGFALAKAAIVLVAGASARADAHLALGSMTERVVVQGQRSSALAAPRAPDPSQRIRVGGSVKPVKLIRQPRPVYPAELQQLGVEGTVIIAAIISKDGSVLNPTVKNTVDPRLAMAALDAVRQWAYEPSLLNGEPVEVLTSITLEFRLGQ